MIEGADAVGNAEPVKLVTKDEVAMEADNRLLDTVLAFNVESVGKALGPTTKDSVNDIASGGRLPLPITLVNSVELGNSRLGPEVAVVLTNVDATTEESELDELLKLNELEVLKIDELGSVAKVGTAGGTTGTGVGPTTGSVDENSRADVLKMIEGVGLEPGVGVVGSTDDDGSVMKVDRLPKRLDEGRIEVLASGGNEDSSVELGSTTVIDGRTGIALLETTLVANNELDTTGGRIEEPTTTEDELRIPMTLDELVTATGGTPGGRLGMAVGERLAMPDALDASVPETVTPDPTLEEIVLLTGGTEAVGSSGGSMTPEAVELGAGTSGGSELGARDEVSTTGGVNV